MTSDKRFGDGLPGQGPPLPPSPPGGGWGSPPAAPQGAPPGMAAGVPPAPGGFPAAAATPLGGPPRPASDSTARPVGAPVVWLAAAGALEIVGLALGLLAAGRPVLSLLGWLLAGFGAISLLAWFTVQDARRHTDPWYSGSRAPGRARAVLVVAAVAVVALNSFRFADWASRH